MASTLTLHRLAKE